MNTSYCWTWWIIAIIVFILIIVFWFRMQRSQKYFSIAFLIFWCVLGLIFFVNWTTPPVTVHNSFVAPGQTVTLVSTQNVSQAYESTSLAINYGTTPGNQTSTINIGVTGNTASTTLLSVTTSTTQGNNYSVALTNESSGNVYYTLSCVPSSPALTYTVVGSS